jgi:ligand-binding sensor domain-containing protein
VTALYQSAKGPIWVGFRDGSMASYHEKKFQLFKPEEGLPKVSITGFAETHDGTLWIATHGEGIYAVSGKQLKNINTDDGLNDNYVHDILGSKSTDAIIAASDQGLNACSFAAGKKSVKNIFDENALPDNIITSLTEIRNTILVGTQDKGICTISIDDGKENIDIPRISKTWQFGMVNKAISVSDEVWIATDDFGLVIAEKATGKFKLNIKGTPYFPHSKINDLVADNEGNVWISCSDGLVKSSGKKIRFWESQLNEKITFVHTIIVDAEGHCWFSPDQGLVKMWQDEEDRKSTR